MKRVGRPPAAISAETMQRIVRATEKSFGLFGYDKTTIKDIALEAELTTGALYHYFDSKQDLFAKVFTQCRDQVVESFAEAAAGTETAVDKLCAILDRAVQLNREDENIARFVSVAEIEIGRHPALAALLRTTASEEGLTSLYERIVRQGVDHGELPAGTDVQGVVDMIDSATAGFAQFAAYRADTQAHQRAVEAFKLLLKGQLWRPVAVGSPESALGEGVV